MNVNLMVYLGNDLSKIKDAKYVINQQELI